jgi:hypothetical protein
MGRLDGLLPKDIADRISIYKKVLDTNGNSSYSISFNWILMSEIVLGYHLGRRAGNYQKIAENYKYTPDKILISEDVNKFFDDYSRDSEARQIEFLEEAERDERVLGEDYIYYLAKRYQVMRDLEVDYLDRWFMYNKLFSDA